MFWTVVGIDPLAGRCRSKAALRGATFARLTKAPPPGGRLQLVQLLVCGGRAEAGLVSDATASSRRRFDNHDCRARRLSRGRTAEVRACLASALVRKLFDETGA